MILTIEEIKERLRSTYDEISILEMLEISGEDLVEAFTDRIEDRYDNLMKQLEENEDEV